MASHNGAVGTREPGPSWQRRQESVERLHTRGQSAGAEEPLRALPGVTPALLSSCLLPALLLQNQSLSSPLIETKPFASQYQGICQQDGGGCPSALRSPGQPLDDCLANVQSLPTSLSLCSRTLFPAPLKLGLTL